MIDTFSVSGTKSVSSNVTKKHFRHCYDEQSNMGGMTKYRLCIGKSNEPDKAIS